MKKKVFAGLFAGFMLLLVAGMASAISYQPNQQVTEVVDEQTTAPKPIHMLLFGTSMVGLMTLGGRVKK